jgi:hypothetical protein
MDELKSREAKHLIDSQVVKQVLDELKTESTNAILNSEPKDIAVREQAYQDIRAVNRLADRLRSLANDLKVYKIPT